MRWTEAFIPTQREISKDAEAASHQMLLKGGFIRKLASGIYSYLPLGFRVLQKVTGVIREEMDRSGALELLLPALHPAELWRQSGRYEALGEDKIAFKNRSGQEFVLGPTHEEVITELAANYLKTHHSLPKILYQIQTKFRDEIRPRFGIIRTKEFMMKDAYSFDADDAGLDRSYQRMYEAYEKIFARLGLAVDIVAADPGVMGGAISHEFMARSPYGEDRIVVCGNQACGYSASRDIAGRALPKEKAKDSFEPLQAFDTPGLKSIEEITLHFKLKKTELVKSLLYFADESAVLACVRGDHEVNEGKLRRALGAKNLRLATQEEIAAVSGAPIGFTGPVRLARKVKIVIDGDVAVLSSFVTGANEKDKHLRNVNVGRDFKADETADLRYVEDGDLCPKCGNPLSIVTTMEVGHVFKLGIRYSEPLRAVYMNSEGNERPMVMGCYGLGVNRILAAIVEQHHDPKGMKWPVNTAPYSIHLLTVNHGDDSTRNTADHLYQEIRKEGWDCLYDDRNERAGVKFNDADLIGCPIQVIVSGRNISKQAVEVKIRETLATMLIPVHELSPKLREILRSREQACLFPTMMPKGV